MSTLFKPSLCCWLNLSKVCQSLKSHFFEILTDFTCLFWPPCFSNVWDFSQNFFGMFSSFVNKKGRFRQNSYLEKNSINWFPKVTGIQHLFESFRLLVRIFLDFHYFLHLLCSATITLNLFLIIASFFISISALFMPNEIK